MRSILSIDIETCTGCRNCELACSIAHNKTFNPARSCIQVIKDEKKNLVIPVVCLHCKQALCEDACPTGAIKKNDKGILVVSNDICVGCGNCVTECIYSGIAIDPVTRKAIKCDLCYGDPECIKACDYDAIDLFKADEIGLSKRANGSKLARSIVFAETREVE
ncbi:MAG: 4Fe-4S dicluster domain-containing protein [Candidatus Hodarchaeota archaeon]